MNISPACALSHPFKPQPHCANLHHAGLQPQLPPPGADLAAGSVIYWPLRSPPPPLRSQNTSSFSPNCPQAPFDAHATRLQASAGAKAPANAGHKKSRCRPRAGCRPGWEAGREAGQRTERPAVRRAAAGAWREGGGVREGGNGRGVWRGHETRSTCRCRRLRVPITVHFLVCVSTPAASVPLSGLLRSLSPFTPLVGEI